MCTQLIPRLSVPTAAIIQRSDKKRSCVTILPTDIACKHRPVSAFHTRILLSELPVSKSRDAATHRQSTLGPDATRLAVVSRQRTPVVWPRSCSSKAMQLLQLKVASSLFLVSRIQNCVRRLDEVRIQIRDCLSEIQDKKKKID